MLKSRQKQYLLDATLAALLINRDLTAESALRFAGILLDCHSKSNPNKTVDRYR